MMMQRGLAASGMLLVLGGVVMACDALYLGYRDFPVEVLCGNGVLDDDETCDDGNSYPGDGCSTMCRIEDRYTCETVGMLCVPEPDAQVVPVNEAEPNNSYKDADKRFPITSSTRIAGSVAPAGKDIFKVQIEGPRAVLFEAFDKSGGACTNAQISIRLEDRTGNQLSSPFHIEGENNGCGSTALNLSAGTAYYAKVTTYSTSTQGYLLNVTINKDTQEAEPNNSIPFSNGIWNNYSASGAIGAAGDVDYYGLYVIKGQSIRAEIIEAPEGQAECNSWTLPSVLRLRDNANNILVEDDSSGRGSCSLIDGTGPDEKTALHGGAHNLKEGHYFLEISGADKSATFPYRLTLVIR